jgi:type I restriction-modification system DNA methylase subunit
MEQNDYNLNVTLYVMQDKEGEGIDIAREFGELKELERQRQEVASKLEQYVSELTQALGGS